MNTSYKATLLISTILLLLSGCIHENMDNCPQGLDIHFYSQTACNPEITYPEQIKDLTLCIFDESETLVKHWHKSNVSLNSDYMERVDIESGTYTIVAWSGIEEANYDINSLQDGITRKTDLLFRLKREQEIAYSIIGTTVYFGESPIIEVKPAIEEPSYEQAKVNMLEVTNRLAINIEGLNENLTTYEITIEANNGSMNVNGSIAEDQTIIYQPEIGFFNNKLEIFFTILKLDINHNYTIVIRNKENNEVIYRENIIASILLKSPYINLNCDHDYSITFNVDNPDNDGTFMITHIWVNDWLVHSYNTDM